MQVFFDLPAFVAMLHRLLGLILDFPERMFRITNRLADGFKRFCHDSNFLRFGLGRRDQRAFLVRAQSDSTGSSRFKRHDDTTTFARSHSKLNESSFRTWREDIRVSYAYHMTALPRVDCCLRLISFGFARTYDISRQPSRCRSTKEYIAKKVFSCHSGAVFPPVGSG